MPGAAQSAPATQPDASTAVALRTFWIASDEHEDLQRRARAGVSVRGAAHGLGGGLGAPIPWIGPRTGPASGHFRSIPKAMSPSASIHIYIPALLTNFAIAGDSH